MLEDGQQPPYGRKMAVSLVEAGPGHAVFERTPDHSCLNPMGTVHGGYAAAMLDSACGIAAHTGLKAGQAYTTLELKTSFLRPLTPRSGTVRAVGRLVSMTRRAAFAEATLHDASGRLCATATSTLLVFDARGKGGNSPETPR
ncbi:PaaI family thioesterase [Sphingomonas sp. RRHST34]|uniref:PaaI family thioesterase n=2 Tax=Sphingomonas citri TaxID=2862499 RepID=A0ABS7BT12_9SPHN|nr:PaaI family thioesterase [Sphingomonas citri]